MPLDRLTLVAHSMGGLVARSACWHAERGGGSWLQRLGDLVFLGTPHFGAPLARGVHWAHMALRVSPYTAALALLGKVRSAGAADLRHGYVLDEDWLGRDPAAAVLPAPTPVPLPSGVRCLVVAGCRARTPAGRWPRAGRGRARRFARSPACAGRPRGLPLGRARRGPLRPAPRPWRVRAPQVLAGWSGGNGGASA